MLRLYTMLMISRYPVSLKELAQRMNCSKQTIIRLVALLEASEYGKILSERRGREMFYALDKPQNISGISLNGQALAQLALCRELLVKLLPPNMLESMNQTLDGALAYLPEGIPDSQKEIATSLSKGHIDYAPYEDILNRLISGISESKICMANYRSKRSNPEKSYNLAPVRLIIFNESIFVSAFILDGNDKPKYDNPAIFSLQRFTSCKLTRRKFPPLADDPHAKNNFLGIMTDEPFEVAVRFSPDAATYAAERQWSSKQCIEDLEDGSIILRLTVNNPAECVSWVLGFGEKAELIEPDWLRGKLRGIAERLCGIYQEVRDGEADVKGG